MLLLLRAIVSLTPKALDPILSGQMAWWQWLIMGTVCLFMLYAEGYKGFQKRFSPMVAARAVHLAEHPTLLRIVLAPLWCIGLFHAKRRRLIVSWSVLCGVTALIITMNFVPQPWRGIVDAGVVVGLTWGAGSLIWSTVVAMRQGSEEHLAQLPTTATS